MKKIKFLILLFIFLTVGCDIVATPKSIEPEPIPDIFMDNLNIDDSTKDDWEEGFYDESEDFLKWDFYTLELGRTDPDIQSQKTYTFYLPKDVVFELMGVDAQSSIIEFKKGNKVIFSWHNRDYVVDEDAFDIMYPEWNNYSFVGGHTNVLFFDEENDAIYEDDLYVFEDSLKIDNQLVFE